MLKKALVEDIVDNLNIYSGVTLKPVSVTTMIIFVLGRDPSTPFTCGSFWAGEHPYLKCFMYQYRYKIIDKHTRPDNLLYIQWFICQFNQSLFTLVIHDMFVFEILFENHLLRISGMLWTWPVEQMTMVLTKKSSRFWEKLWKSKRWHFNLGDFNDPSFTDLRNPMKLLPEFMV